jgi:hypothetical protein
LLPTCGLPVPSAAAGRVSGSPAYSSAPSRAWTSSWTAIAVGAGEAVTVLDQLPDGPPRPSPRPGPRRRPPRASRRRPRPRGPELDLGMHAWCRGCVGGGTSSTTCGLPCPARGAGPMLDLDHAGPFISVGWNFLDVTDPATHHRCPVTRRTSWGIFGVQGMGLHHASGGRYGHVLAGHVGLLVHRVVHQGCLRCVTWRG